jgi:hypothetical protein
MKGMMPSSTERQRMWSYKIIISIVIALLRLREKQIKFG